MPTGFSCLSFSPPSGPQQPAGGSGAAPGLSGGQEDQGAECRHQVDVLMASGLQNLLQTCPNLNPSSPFSCRASTLSSAVSSLSSTGMSFSRMDEKEKQQALEEEQARLQALKVTDCPLFFPPLHRLTFDPRGCRTERCGISGGRHSRPFLPFQSHSSCSLWAAGKLLHGSRIYGQCIFDAATPTPSLTAGINV